MHDTIAAISSPVGKGAISIIRVSGPMVFKILSKIFKPDFKSKNINKVGILTGNIINGKNVIDHVVILINKKPKTYTGEDLLEIQCHGNPIITNIIMNLLISHGTRMAGPGEFTLRAFLNDKIDLIQAEAINDLITSDTYSSIELALNQLKGELSGKINRIDQFLKKLLINIEVLIDHSEDNFFKTDLKGIKRKVDKIVLEIESLIDSYDIGTQIRKGLNISIIGKANAGKSSLFNLLIKRDKAIISPIPGTTRDVIEEFIELNNCLIKITDTAGLKKAINHIEKEALKRTVQSIEEANILLVLFDNSNRLNKDDTSLLDIIPDNNLFKIIIINKCDLASKTDPGKIRKMFPGNRVLRISVSRETGIKNLEAAIAGYTEKFDIKKNLIISNIRHKNIFISLNKHLKNMIKSIEDNLYYDIICSDLRKAVNELGKITGKYTTENMLEDIFSNFCIGK